MGEAVNVQDLYMNTIERKFEDRKRLVSIVRCDRTLAQKTRFAAEAALGVPLSVSAATEYALQEFLRKCSMNESDFPDFLRSGDGSG